MKTSCFVDLRTTYGKKHENVRNFNRPDRSKQLINEEELIECVSEISYVVIKTTTGSFIFDTI